jgi:hypothetical protein
LHIATPRCIILYGILKLMKILKRWCRLDFGMMVVELNLYAMLNVAYK